ncbi:uncharacterized protein LOC112032105 [Quercus suber]|uniref:uncharacterized protein LOC112032105 n=1 Tax=Quercus suber TaxID=58331 RepID=UPI0032DF38CE
MKRVMVDQSNDAEIMYPDLYKGLNLRSKDLIAYDSPLVSFDGKVVIPRGQIKLPVEAGSEVVEVDFIVVDAYSPYTAIMARHWLYALGAVSSTLHQKIEAQLPLLEKEELIEFLRKNVDVFTWSAYETPRVDPSFMYHHLNVNPSVTPKKQPPQRSSKDYFDTVRDKVMKLKQAGAIKEVFYPEWLANTVVAKKKSGMTMVQRMGGKAAKMFSDLRLVVGQVKGEFEARDERMQGYLSQRQQNYSLRSYMRGFVEATLEADPCRTEPSLKAIGG